MGGGFANLRQDRERESQHEERMISNAVDAYMQYDTMVRETLEDFRDAAYAGTRFAHAEIKLYERSSDVKHGMWIIWVLQDEDRTNELATVELAVDRHGKSLNRFRVTVERIQNYGDVKRVAGTLCKLTQADLIRALEKCYKQALKMTNFARYNKVYGKYERMMERRNLATRMTLSHILIAIGLLFVMFVLHWAILPEFAPSDSWDSPLDFIANPFVLLLLIVTSLYKPLMETASDDDLQIGSISRFFRLFPKTIGESIIAIIGITIVFAVSFLFSHSVVARHATANIRVGLICLVIGVFHLLTRKKFAWYSSVPFGLVYAIGGLSFHLPDILINVSRITIIDRFDYWMEYALEGVLYTFYLAFIVAIQVFISNFVGMLIAGQREKLRTHASNVYALLMIGAGLFFLVYWPIVQGLGIGGY